MEKGVGKIEVICPKYLAKKIGLPAKDELDLFEENLRRKAGLTTESVTAASDTGTAIQGVLRNEGSSSLDNESGNDSERILKEDKVSLIMTIVELFDNNPTLVQLEMLLEFLDFLGISYTEVLPQLTDDFEEKIRGSFLNQIIRDAVAQMKDPDYIGKYIEDGDRFEVKKSPAQVAFFINRPIGVPKLEQLAKDSDEYQQTLKLYLKLELKKILARRYGVNLDSDNNFITIMNVYRASTSYLSDWLKCIRRAELDVKDVLGKELHEIFSIVAGNFGEDGTISVSEESAKEYFSILMASDDGMEKSLKFLIEQYPSLDRMNIFVNWVTKNSVDPRELKELC